MRTADSLQTSSTSMSPGTASDKTPNVNVGCFGNSSRNRVSNELQKEPKVALSAQS